MHTVVVIVNFAVLLLGVYTFWMGKNRTKEDREGKKRDGFLSGKKLQMTGIIMIAVVIAASGLEIVFHY